MARTITRGQPMTGKIAIRATEDDIASLKLEAMKTGLDVSAFVRQLLIKEKIIKPLG